MGGKDEVKERSSRLSQPVTKVFEKLKGEA